MQVELHRTSERRHPKSLLSPKHRSETFDPKTWDMKPSPPRLHNPTDNPKRRSKGATERTTVFEKAPNSLAGTLCDDLSNLIHGAQEIVSYLRDLQRFISPIGLKEEIKSSGGTPKTGHAWTLQNRPTR
jgi:hypothetical protein